MAIFEVKATLLASKQLVFENNIPQNSGEHMTTTLTIFVPKTFEDFDFYLEFSCPQAKKYISPKLTPHPVDDENFCLKYDVENILLQNEGLVLVQLVARAMDDNSVVFRSQKSTQSSFFVTSSITSFAETMRVNDYFTQTEENLKQTMDSLLPTVQNINSILDLAAGKMGEIDAACLQAQSTVESILTAKQSGEFSAKVSVGTVTIVENERDAKIENVGTPENAVLNFFVPKGDAGTFRISKVYSSILEMNAGFASDNVPFGALVVIETGDVESPDNAKLFLKGESSYEFLTDMSGARGIEGPKGDTGEAGPQGERGDPGLTTAVVDSLTSTSETEALSANQGRILNELIGDINTVLSSVVVGV